MNAEGQGTSLSSAVALQWHCLITSIAWTQAANTVSGHVTCLLIFYNQQSAMQMNRCRHLQPLYPYHAT